jgi:hypothetical protein
MYLQPEITKAVEGQRHLSTASLFDRLQSNAQKGGRNEGDFILFLHTYFINKIANFCSILIATQVDEFAKVRLLPQNYVINCSSIYYLTNFINLHLSIMTQ